MATGARDVPDDHLFDSVPIGVLKVDADWRVSYLNPAGAAVVGYTAEQLVGRDYWTAFPANATNEFGRAYRDAVATGRPCTLEGFYPAPLNAWFEVQAVPEGGGLAMYFSDVTERRTAQERLAMLARVSAELAGTLDVDTAATRVPRLIVPVMADWCILTVLDDEGRPADVGWWHTDPTRRALVERYAGVRLDAMPVTSPVVRALLGETVAADTAEVLTVMAVGEARELLELLHPTAAITMPLRGRGRTLGALTLYFEGDRCLNEAEQATAQEIADRAGLALDNARLFSQQRQLAEELQRSLLTGAFTHDHAEVVVRYTPAAEAARVGGDWYDSFTQPSGSTMLVIGDVVGHDTAAAAAMGQLRSLLRGIASYSDGGPAEVLRGLDAAMHQLEVGTYATAAVARFEQTHEERSRGVTRMRWSNAGHLPPLVINPDGSLAALADWRGELLLGVDPATPRGEQVVVLDRGTTVLLYTDGLIERRGGDLDEGMARLRQAASELAGLPLGELCDQLVDRLVHGQPEDDVALVAIRLLPQG
ncbi:SpoIIE family protein phosphatase [Modestobacter versicolor]|uniref:PAS domain S-box protein n=1 Tax=Modestobacter versicolor TaxID=429133 RepID=A0A323VCZ1_9ACTN|nr:SpoIIE family protein phosphatase [Modestobacter versicolor]MBB3677486.1 PAS domain S-box-containing protein [Modestobacter versicolor]PZA22575.1 PAS domain S-box protein [Modestobacter versicolor]